MPEPLEPTRARLIKESMRLFGEKGYAGTSVSEIEAAAGLSGGSGSLYRHFRSKEELLSAGVREQIAAGKGLLDLVREARAGTDAPLRASLAMIAVAGLRRLEEERDFNRIIIKDLSLFPELLGIARTEEIGRIHVAITNWLEQHAAPDASADWRALATVIIGSITHYWLLRDIFGEHPSEVNEERFVETLVDFVLTGLGAGSPNEPIGA